MDRNLIETAFVSGRLGQAIYRVDEDLYALELGSTPRRASPAELAEVLRRGAEYQLLHRRTVDQVQDELQKLVRSYNALFLVLSLLDLETSLSARVVAAQAAEELLSGAEDREFVARRLLSLPLPIGVRAHRHQIVSPWAEFERVKPLLSEVFESQSIIDELWAGWGRALDSQVIDETTKSSLEATLVYSGFFAEATRSISAGDNYRFNSAVVQYATATETTAELRTAQSLLTTFRSEVHSKFFGGTKRAVQKPLKLKKGERSPLPRPVQEDAISELIYDMDARGERPKRYVGALEAKARVDKQIEAIREALFAGKNSTAEKYLEDLLAFQLGQGDREHAAMSLCALTGIALDANQFEIADRLSQYALKLTSDDKVVYTNRAEVFKRRGHFDAALKAYQEAIERFGQGRYARNGYADVLKDKGRFDEAIERYKEVQKDIPEDPVAFNGEVSVLRANGELRKALSVALANAKRFEYDAVTRSTLASSLASLGKYDEAIRHYRVAMNLDRTDLGIHVSYVYTLSASGDLDSALRHADSVIKKLPEAVPMIYAKASLLRNAGLLEDAYALYEKLLALYPTYTPAKFGAAAIWVLQNRSEEARTVLPETNMESELDWYGFRIRALSFARTGNFERAAPRLSFGSGQCLWLKERTKLETALGLVELQKGDTARSIAVLNKNLHQLDDRHQQIRLAFLGHAHAEKGAVDVASVMLGRLFTSKDLTLQSMRETIIVKYDIPLPRREYLPIMPEQMATQELALAMAA
jgi:tetratricopeptide (TPR) repeat protein